MKPKNIMLLGFVNKAVDYLDKHIEDEEFDSKLTELKNIDLQSIKNELSESLELSLGVTQSTMATLLNAGNQAFDKFLENHEEKLNLNEQLDFFDEFDNNGSKNNKDLARLLSFYNLEDFEEEEIDEIIEEVNPPVEEKKDEIQDELLRKIADNACKASQYKGKCDNVEISNEESKEIDNILTEILQEKPNDTLVEDETVEEIVEEPVISKEDTVENTKETVEILEVPSNNNINREEEIQVQESEAKENIVEEEKQAIEIEDTSIQEGNAIEDKESDEEYLTDLKNFILNNPGIDYTPIVEETPIYDSSKQEEIAIPGSNVIDEEYVNNVYEELRKKMVAEDEAKRIKEEQNAEVYAKIHEVYPILKEDFVKAVYDLKESLENEKPSKDKVIMLHRCSFADVDELRQYVEIVLNHDYQITADETKGIVDTFRELENNSDVILANIYEVANQATVLNGIYEGYRVY